LVFLSTLNYDARSTTHQITEHLFKLLKNRFLSHSFTFVVFFSHCRYKTCLSPFCGSITHIGPRTPRFDVYT